MYLAQRSGIENEREVEELGAILWEERVGFSDC